MSDERRGRRIPVRWVTLAEAVAIAAVAVSGLGLYNSWQRDKTPTSTSAATGQPLTLRATVEREGERLAISPAVESQSIQSQTVAFPTGLSLSPVETTGEPRIEAGWIDKPLRKAAGDDPSRGDRRVPVLVTTRYLEGAAERTDTSLYQLGYTVAQGGLFGGDHVRLSGLSLAARGVKDGQRRLDSSWRPVRRE